MKRHFRDFATSIRSLREGNRRTAPDAVASQTPRAASLLLKGSVALPFSLFLTLVLKSENDTSRLARVTRRQRRPLSISRIGQPVHCSHRLESTAAVVIVLRRFTRGRCVKLGANVRPICKSRISQARGGESPDFPAVSGCERARIWSRLGAEASHPRIVPSAGPASRYKPQPSFVA